MAMTINRNGVAVAAGLIRAGRVNRTSPWSFSSEDGDELLSSGGSGRTTVNWNRYASFHLGRREAQNPQTRGAWAYPFGKLVDGKAMVYRSALIAIRQRASQQGLRRLYESAGRLLQRIDSGGQQSEHVFSGSLYGGSLYDTVLTPEELAAIDRPSSGQ